MRLSDMTLRNWSEKGGMEDIKSRFLLSLPIVYSGSTSVLYPSPPQCVAVPACAAQAQRHRSGVASGTGKGPRCESKLGLTMKCLQCCFFKNMINFKPRQRNNRVEEVGVISNYYFIVCFGSKPRRLKGRPCNKISFAHLFYFNS